MALSDIIIPYRTVTIHQASEEKPTVVVDVFGLTTSDFMYLLNGYKEDLALLFLKKNKLDFSTPGVSKIIFETFPDFAAACIACGCKQREVERYAQNFTLTTSIELLITILDLTFPEGLKKSLERLWPMVEVLLR